jgi:hypothetical protein
MKGLSIYIGVIGHLPIFTIMRNCIFICLLLVASEYLMAQITVKELDKEQKERKRNFTKLKTGKKDSLLVVYLLRPENRIYSVMKRERFGPGKQVDSILEYQFGYINDTLLRIWYSRTNFPEKKRGFLIAYLSNRKIVAIHKRGDIYLPDQRILDHKSAELIELANVLIETKTKSP